MSMSEMEYTRLLTSVKDELGSEFQQLQSREEYDKLRRELADIVAQLNKEISVEAKLYSNPLVSDAITKLYLLLSTALPNERIKDPGFPTSKIEFDSVLSSFDTIAEKLKTSAELDEAFLTILENNYPKYKSSEDYIRKLVLRRLMEISPEFVCQKGKPNDSANDVEGYALNFEHSRILDEKVFEKNSNGSYSLSTRLLILKQFIKQFGWCEGVKHSNKDVDGEGYDCFRLKFLIEDSGKSQNEFAMEIDESIFEDLQKMDVDLNVREQYEYFNQILETLKTERITYSEDITRRHLELLANIQYKYGKAVKTRNGQLTIEQKIKNESSLIKAAKSIGSASFGKVSPNREYLYVFAIAFEMTVPQSAKLPVPGDCFYTTDIRKNLFYDFYSDNIINSLLKGEKDTQAESVSGYGINYKNFAEIVYLYYIGQISLSSLQKFSLARSTIEECIEQYKTGSYGNSNDNKNTALENNSFANDTSYYTESFERNFFAKIFGFSENELKKYLLSEYECYYNNIQDVGLSNEHRTAVKLYVDLLQWLEKKNKKIRFSKLEIPSDKTSEVENNDELNKIIKGINQNFTNERKLRKIWSKYDDLMALYADVINNGSGGIDFNEFLELLDRGYYSKIEKNEPHLNYNFELVINRSELLICCCNYIIILLSFEEKEKKAKLAFNFKEFYDYCTEKIKIMDYNGLNDALLKCGFMEINHKSLFDIVVMYLIYKNVLSH